MDKMMKIREYISELTLQKVRDLSAKELVGFNTQIITNSSDKKISTASTSVISQEQLFAFLQLVNSGDCVEWYRYQR